MSTPESGTNQSSGDELLEGLVAQLLNERELVINIGSDAGVREGMEFAVLADMPIQIVDPGTNEPLGNLDHEKVRVRATQILAKMAVCRTFKSWNVGGQLNFLASYTAEAFGPRKTVYETFNAEKEAFPKPLTGKDSYVKIGDRVREVIETGE